MVLPIGVSTDHLWCCDSYSIGQYYFGAGPFNYSNKHSRKACILITAIDDGFNNSMFCYVLNYNQNILPWKYKCQCFNCWRCCCHLPDKDSPRIGKELAQHKKLNPGTYTMNSILEGGNSNELEFHMEWYGLCQLNFPQ